MGAVVGAFVLNGYGQETELRINLIDPETGQPYGYTIRDATTYELCATFSLERNSDVEVFWNHSPGRQCFTVDALDPPTAR